VRPPPVPLPHQAQSERYPGKSALIIGATGATGQHLLRYLLSSPEYTRVAEFGRRLTSTSDPKLEQHTLDFEKLGADDQGLKAGRWDVVFLTYAHTPRMLLVDIDGCFQTGYHPCGCRKC
jgi:N-acetyl-gamma-glutamylphosphate reductase